MREIFRARPSFFVRRRDYEREEGVYTKIQKYFIYANFLKVFYNNDV